MKKELNKAAQEATAEAKLMKASLTESGKLSAAEVRKTVKKQKSIAKKDLREVKVHSKAYVSNNPDVVVVLMAATAVATAVSILSAFGLVQIFKASRR